MPEGDTVFRMAASLRGALEGKELTRCDVRVLRYATIDLTGHVVDEVFCRGKHLFIRVGGASIHSHLKMDGKWVIGRVRAPAYKVRIVLETVDSRASGVDLGVLEILERAVDMEAVAHLGPDLLGDDWSAEVAAANLMFDPSRPLAETLRDQRVMAGVGNVYANELCFVFGLRPGTAVCEARDPLRLATRAQQMLWANRSRGSRTTTGDTRPGRDLWVYGRAGLACRRCGTLIETETETETGPGSDTGAGTGPTTDTDTDDAGGRVTFWCPRCQR